MPRTHRVVRYVVYHDYDSVVGEVVNSLAEALILADKYPKGVYQKRLIDAPATRPLYQFRHQRLILV